MNRILSFIPTLAIAFSAIFLSSCGKKDYEEQKIDKLVSEIIKTSDINKTKELLDYQKDHSVDAIFAKHYYANLYWINEKHPGIFDKFKNGDYESTVEEALKNGDKALRDYYPDGKKE